MPDAGRPGGDASTCARERVARLVCADAEQLAPAEIDAIAAYLHAEQVGQIEAAARQVATRVADGAAPVVPLGAGAFLARAAAERLGRPVRRDAVERGRARRGAGRRARRARRRRVRAAC